MKLKDLKNKDKAVLVNDLTTINGFVWPKDTEIEMENCLSVTAIIRTPDVECEHTDFPLYYKSVVKSEAMHTNIKKV